MRIAILSDIHSNLFALEAVISDIKQRNADITVNLGDILYGPIAPRATYDLLQEYDFVTISGNQDRQIAEASQTEIEANPTLQFILEELGPEPLDWLRNLPGEKRLTDEIYLCHGSPNDDMTYLLESVESGLPGLRSDREILQLLNGHQEAVILCGHTHIARAVFTSTRQLIVNPGSVGLPAYTDDIPVRHSMQSFSPHTTYAMIENCGRGWSVQHIKVAYDYQKAVALAQQRNRADWAHFLATGRGL